MKSFGLFLIVLFVLAGCNNPAEVTQEEIYTESVMMNISDASEGVRAVDTPNGVDRKFARMLLSLKRYVKLDSTQWVAVKDFAQTLATEMKAIHDGVKSGNLTKEQARVQLKEARKTFVESVTSILTDEQKPRFRRWLHLFW